MVGCMFTELVNRCILKKPTHLDLEWTTFPSAGLSYYSFFSNNGSLVTTTSYAFDEHLNVRCSLGNESVHSGVYVCVTNGNRSLSDDRYYDNNGTRVITNGSSPYTFTDHVLSFALLVAFTFLTLHCISCLLL